MQASYADDLPGQLTCRDTDSITMLVCDLDVSIRTMSTDTCMTELYICCCHLVVLSKLTFLLSLHGCERHADKQYYYPAYPNHSVAERASSYILPADLWMREVVLPYMWIYLIGAGVEGPREGECVISTFCSRPFSFRQRAEVTVVI